MIDNYTHIVLLLDRSGSMSRIAKETIEGYNSFLSEQQKLDGKATLTLALFDDQYELIHDFVDIKDAKPLDNKTYFARGWTALLDALGKTIDATGVKLASMKEEDRPGRVLVMCFTDGQENYSKEYLGQKVKDMATHQQDKYSWQFIFVGANIDTIAASKAVGIDARNTYSYDASSAGTASLYSSVSIGVSDFRKSAVRSAYAMPAPQLDDDAPTTKIK